MSEPIITSLKASQQVQVIPGNTHTSAMIALGMPDAVAQQLVVPGGHPAQEMHVTRAFYPAPLGEPQAWDTLAQVLKGLAAATPAPVCHLGGSGRFMGLPDGKDACILNVDAPDINELRQACVHVAERLGLEHSKQAAQLHAAPHGELRGAGRRSSHAAPEGYAVRLHRPGVVGGRPQGRLPVQGRGREPLPSGRGVRQGRHCSG